MIRQLFKIPRGCYVACSGGADSMAVLDFLNRSNKVRGALYFDHKTEQSRDFESVVSQYCTDNKLEMLVKIIDEEHRSGSKEDFWSKKRNEFFKAIDAPVVTGHNLDDAVEWWIYTSLKGNPRLLPSSNQNIIRPFIVTPKLELQKWADKNGVSYLQDRTNFDTKFMRNFIRHQLLDQCRVVNPGIRKTIFKKINERECNVPSTR